MTIDPRILMGLQESISCQLDLARMHAGQTDEDMCFFHIDKASKLLEEFRREVYRSGRRSGEVVRGNA